MQKDKSYGILAILCCAVFLANMNTGCQNNTLTSKDDSISYQEEKIPILEFSKTITAEDLKEHVSFLASDKMEGRQSGSEGELFGF